MMERIQSINRERIAWCCADQGTSREALAHAIGITPANLDKVMAGEHGLTFNQLRKLADWSGRGVLFFMEPGPVNATKVHSPQFRSLNNQKPELSARLKQLIERVERQREVFLNPGEAGLYLDFSGASRAKRASLHPTASASACFKTSLTASEARSGG